ncbi:PREDICTED: cell wall protein RBR3-like [Priapulus caudatus]|uniref:Cell wall protein RBR3-like n=1 Tax=Priapulus caudatus TaxID=37621 RepID=A0ABM1EDH3_PRICU|nr:PREDICTED: cell wall protein RBR3-like [Priapulus caudatus]
MATATTAAFPRQRIRKLLRLKLGAFTFEVPITLDHDASAATYACSASDAASSWPGVARTSEPQARRFVSLLAPPAVAPLPARATGNDAATAPGVFYVCRVRQDGRAEIVASNAPPAGGATAAADDYTLSGGIMRPAGGATAAADDTLSGSILRRLLASETPAPPAADACKRATAGGRARREGFSCGACARAGKPSREFRHMHSLLVHIATRHRSGRLDAKIATATANVDKHGVAKSDRAAMMAADIDESTSAVATGTDGAVSTNISESVATVATVSNSAAATNLSESVTTVTVETNRAASTNLSESTTTVAVGTNSTASTNLSNSTQTVAVGTNSSASTNLSDSTTTVAVGTNSTASMRHHKTNSVAAVGSKPLFILVVNRRRNDRLNETIPTIATETRAREATDGRRNAELPASSSVTTETSSVSARGTADADSRAPVIVGGRKRKRETENEAGDALSTRRAVATTTGGEGDAAKTSYRAKLRNRGGGSDAGSAEAATGAGTSSGRPRRSAARCMKHGFRFVRKEDGICEHCMDDLECNLCGRKLPNKQQYSLHISFHRPLS